MSFETDKKVEASMQIIANAGDGRDCIQKALTLLGEGKYEDAEPLLRQAGDLIGKAHVSQTEILQKALEEETEEGVRILFTHAQDTLMTINSEYYLARQIAVIAKALNEKIERLGERLDEKNL